MLWSPRGQPEARIARVMMLPALVFMLWLRPTCATTGTPVQASCCQANLMDTQGHVMVESETKLTTGIKFQSVITRLCTDVQVRIQIWQLYNDTNGTEALRFRWEQVIVPGTSLPVGPQPSPPILLDEPIIFDDNSRLAVYSPEGTTIAIPYDHNANHAFYMSKRIFKSNHTFTSTDEIYLDELLWPRSFGPYIVWCTAQYCQPGILFPSSPHEQERVYMGPPGKPGPPGQTGAAGPPGNLIGFDLDALQCDVPDVTREVAKTNQQIGDLKNTVETMMQTLDSIYNSNLITGICPTGTQSGEYGLGSCYNIIPIKETFGTAEIKCRTEFDGHLVKLDNAKEESFLLRQILLQSSSFNDNNSSRLFYTSAMYSTRGEAGWYWYHEPVHREKVRYTNWPVASQSNPRPSRNTNVCMALSINPKTTQSVWRIVNCSLYLYYICEIPKKCL